MSEQYIKKGVLTLVGKRIVSFTTAEFHIDDAPSFEPEVYEDTTNVYVDMDIIERLQQSAFTRFYYEDGDIHDQTILYGEFDQMAIVADSDEFATYRIECDEVMDFVITQMTGHLAPNNVVRKEPIDGVIQFQIDSKVIGKVLVYGVSDSYYTNEAELFIK